MRGVIPNTVIPEIFWIFLNHLDPMLVEWYVSLRKIRISFKWHR